MSDLHHDLERLLAAAIGSATKRDRIAQTLKPLYDAATSAYPLAPVGTLDPGDVGTALALATGQPASSVALVRCGAIRPTVADDVDASRLGNLLRDRYCLDLHRRLGDARLAALDAHVASFDERLEEALWSAVLPRLPDSFAGKPSLDMRYGMRTALRAYLGRVLCNDDVNAHRLVPLLRLLAHAVPVGEAIVPPHYWFILVE